jgi:FkbM family methyltransferase
VKFLSYAQNQEDVLLNRIFADRPNGFYIDVGAFHPVIGSVTKLFYDRGWHGINIEPISTLLEYVAHERGRDINLPVGLSNREGTLKFYEVLADRGLSTFSTEQAEEHRHAGYEFVEHSIPVTTLARVCEQYDVPTIDFLKIDVEGFEREVLEGADWGRFRPRVVVIEATKPNQPIPSHEHWEPLLLSADYLFAFFDGLNRYYVRSEDRELVPLLSVPANVFDDFEPYEHRFRVQDFEHQIEKLRHSIEGILESRENFHAVLTGARAALEESQAGLATARQELAASRSELDRTRAALDEAKAALGEMDADLKRSQAEFDTARARLDLFEGWGPMTISVVRRVRGISARFPRTKSLVKRAILMRRRFFFGAAFSPTLRGPHVDDARLTRPVGVPSSSGTK